MSIMLKLKFSEAILKNIWPVAPSNAQNKTNIITIVMSIFTSWSPGPYKFLSFYNPPRDYGIFNIFYAYCLDMARIPTFRPFNKKILLAIFVIFDFIQ